MGMQRDCTFAMPSGWQEAHLTGWMAPTFPLPMGRESRADGRANDQRLYGQENGSGGKEPDHYRKGQTWSATENDGADAGSSPNVGSSATGAGVSNSDSRAAAHLPYG